MKKLLILTLTLASFGVFGFGSQTAEAKAATVAPQIRVQLGQQRYRRYPNYRRVRTVRQTRVVQRGWRRYRETYLVRYFPNGYTQTTLISRERIS